MIKFVLFGLVVSIVLNGYLFHKCSGTKSGILERTITTIVNSQLGTATDSPSGYYLMDLGISQTIWIFNPSGTAREVVFYPEVDWKLDSGGKILIAPRSTTDFEMFGVFYKNVIKDSQGDYTNDYKKIEQH